MSDWAEPSDFVGWGVYDPLVEEVVVTSPVALEGEKRREEQRPSNAGEGEKTHAAALEGEKEQRPPNVGEGEKRREEQRPPAVVEGGGDLTDRLSKMRDWFGRTAPAKSRPPPTVSHEEVARIGVLGAIQRTSMDKPLASMDLYTQLTGTR